MFVTITASAPYVAVFLLAVIGVWIGATRLLGKQFVELTAPHPVSTKIEVEPIVSNSPALSGAVQ